MVTNRKKGAGLIATFQELHSFSRLMSPHHTLPTHTPPTEVQQTSSPVLSQLCTLVSGVAQNFATSCELIRHIFSSF